MSYHWCDNVHTTVFTPRDYQVELVAAAVERNIMVCIGHKSSKDFISLKVIQELAYDVRSKEHRKRTLYLTVDEKSAEAAFNLIHYLTDLKVMRVPEDYFEDEDSIDVKDAQVIVANCSDFERLLDDALSPESLNLIIAEDCHESFYRNFYEDLNEYCPGPKPKILGLAGPLYNVELQKEYLRVILQRTEASIACQAETASDIVTVLRYCLKPAEYIIQCAPPGRDELMQFLEELVCTKRAFLKDHRFDPSEIYSDEFLEELKAIPDPKQEPLQFLNSYLEILLEMGPWCADRAALNLLTQIERQKVKTPYERHFLLLCLVSTTLVEIRSYCDYLFQKIPNEKERIEKYSSPKVLRLFEMLRLFKPEEIKVDNERLAKVADEIDNLDFQKLQIELEKTYQNVENEPGKVVEDVIENLGSILHDLPQVPRKPDVSDRAHPPQREVGDNFSRCKRGLPGRQKRKHYFNHGVRHKHFNNSTDCDALYGLIFCDNRNTAKVLFDLLVEMSRHDPDLSFLSVQYTVDRTADPLTEPKEAELEHRRQEEVLKRFRMHECNLLIGTAVLEEGIDLPKCNLVIRWDPPTTYRSYAQCKGRARAAQALHLILVGPKLQTLLDGNDQLSDRSHYYICAPDDDNQPESNAEVKDKVEDNVEDKINSAPELSSDGTPADVLALSPASVPTTLKNVDKRTMKKMLLAQIENSLEIQDVDELLNSSASNYTSMESYVENKSFENNEEVPKKHACLVAKASGEDILNFWTPPSSFKEMKEATDYIIKNLAEYRELEKILLQKCANSEPPEEEHTEADKYTKCIKPYKPLPDLLTSASVDLSNAIALVNKYCAKLPSDTFTKLTPLWRCAKTTRKDVALYQYTIRLPINSPLKYDILGLPMPSKVLARRMAALIACKELHQCGELDDNLQPIGKEGFKASESDWEDFELEELDEQIVSENSEPRPGTTKRRQYYYKRIASEFSNCRPTVGSEAYLYLINMTLQCPIPEEQNTRGRKIYPPEDAVQGFGILTLKKIPKVSAFPIFTRSGEVKVAIELSKERICLTEMQIERINTFLNYTFTNVLRLQKFLMLFDAEAAENCIYIVPTVKTLNKISIDWEFLEVIYNNADKMPCPIPEDIRQSTEFDPNKFKDAVVMPWYRNQDQPQYFYVAEICYHLSPESSFPGENYSTFQEYYFLKYGITIQNRKQPLLDVDHTSARLNFLTPRYVNRKGVALPTSSEETKRAKRENLEQKQILVPELCTIHPFPASLWRAAVCLPCILYRINGLLLADEIRKKVSYELGLGQMEIEDENFEWPILDFGWSLAEVLRKSREAKQPVAKSEDSMSKKEPDACTISDSKKSDLETDGSENTTENQNAGAKTDQEAQPSEEKREEKTANDLLEEVDEKLKSDCLLEIGTWSNDMANNIKMDREFEDNEDWGILPPNVNLCSRNNTNIRYGSPTSWDVGGSSSNPRPMETYYTDSDASFQSDDDYDNMSVESDDDQAGPIRIEFKSNNTAEAVETEEEVQKIKRQMALLQDRNTNDKAYQIAKKEISFQLYPFHSGDLVLKECAKEFKNSIEKHVLNIQNSNMLIPYTEKLQRPKKGQQLSESFECDPEKILTLLSKILGEATLKNEIIKEICTDVEDPVVSIEDLYKINQSFVAQNGPDKYKIEGSGYIFDNFYDYFLKSGGTNEIYMNYALNNRIIEKITDSKYCNNNHEDELKLKSCGFSFDYQPDLVGHPGPSPSIILQALTMSNANDGINLERLETIGDSFLKYAITTYLYCKYEDVHEGKLSHLRSKQVSNLNLYRLGRRKVLGECMIATKFEPHDNWLPPCYYVPKELEKALIEAKIPPCHWNLADLPNIKNLSSEKICDLVKKKAEALGLLDDDDMEIVAQEVDTEEEANENFPCFIPYNLVTQHSIPDKSIADCVEALIGAYLIECGPRGALLFMAWLGIRVLPIIKEPYNAKTPRTPGSIRSANDADEITIYGYWTPPKSPLLTFAPNAQEQLELLLDGFSAFEQSIGYHFRDRSYLLQAMTHASYSPNRLTDCYQRLEFLGDAVLDYLITRHLYEDPRQHSPGALTDLRSALVNNTIFASLAVRHGFHKYFRHLSPGLNEVIDRFVRIQHENGHSISEEYYLLSEEECDDAEDVEVPKALGDVFESVAGAIFLDSNMSLDTVWEVYSNMMKPEIEQFSNSVPKSPIRELLELEPETAKFGKPEKLADGRRVRVTVEVFGKGTFRGIGRNYRIAKCTAAKCALRQLKKQGLISKKH